MKYARGQDPQSNPFAGPMRDKRLWTICVACSVSFAVWPLHVVNRPEANCPACNARLHYTVTGGALTTALR